MIFEYFIWGVLLLVVLALVVGFLEFLRVMLVKYRVHRASVVWHAILNSNSSNIVSLISDYLYLKSKLYSYQFPIGMHYIEQIKESLQKSDEIKSSLLNRIKTFNHSKSGSIRSLDKKHIINQWGQEDIKNPFDQIIFLYALKLDCVRSVRANALNTKSFTPRTFSDSSLIADFKKELTQYLCDPKAFTEIQSEFGGEEFAYITFIHWAHDLIEGTGTGQLAYGSIPRYLDSLDRDGKVNFMSRFAQHMRNVFVHGDLGFMFNNRNWCVELHNSCLIDCFYQEVEEKISSERAKLLAENKEKLEERLRLL
jgi:hypothetical protein